MCSLRLMQNSSAGYQVRFVDYVAEGTPAMGGNDPADRAIHLNLAASMDWCVECLDILAVDLLHPRLGLIPKSDGSKPLHDLESPSTNHDTPSSSFVLRKDSLDPSRRLPESNSSTAGDHTKSLCPPPEPTPKSSTSSSSGSRRTNLRNSSISTLRTDNRSSALSSLTASLETSICESEWPRRRTRITNLSFSEIGRRSATSKGVRFRELPFPARLLPSHQC